LTKKTFDGKKHGFDEFEVEKIRIAYVRKDPRRSMLAQIEIPYWRNDMCRTAHMPTVYHSFPFFCVNSGLEDLGFWV